MKHRLWFFFFAISLVTHAVIFLSGVRDSSTPRKRSGVGIDIQIKAQKKKVRNITKAFNSSSPVKKNVENNHEEKQETQEVVTANTFDNQVLVFNAPVYPRAARRIGASGRVTVAISVNVAGVVTDVRIVKGASFNAFNEVVLESARTWKFKAQRKPITFKKVVNFSIE